MSDNNESVQSESEVPQKDWIETLLESLEMVQWDRFVQAEDDGLGVYFDIYGWIDRDGDAYKDFILLRVFPETDDNLRMFTTSSDRYHDEINEILFGDTGESNHCQRVEHTFEVPNVVEIDEPELATDGGRDTVEAEIGRRDPADDPHACSKCGTYIGMIGDDYCEVCAREIGAKPPMERCHHCGRDAPQEEMKSFDLSGGEEYYPQIRYLCRDCSGGVA